MKKELFNVYPFNLSFDIFKNEEDARNIHIDSFINEIELVSEAETKILKMRYQKGLSLTKIAEHMGLSTGSVKKHIESALESLRSPSRVKYYKAIPYIEKERLTQGK